MANDGKNYEEFVRLLQQALLDAEQVTEQKNIKVEKNKKLIDKNGTVREFDIYWEYELGGVVYKTVIECKDYNSKVSIEKLDALIGKMSDFQDIKALFATKKGYQAGALTKAEQNKIDLLIVREQNDSDWTSRDGTPLVKSVKIAIEVIDSARIIQFDTAIDGEWVEENSELDIKNKLTFEGQTDAIFIEDNEANTKLSLFEIAQKLTPKGDKEYGEFEDTQFFEDGYIVYDDVRLKLKSYTIIYHIGKARHIEQEIDFSKELVGVIEYLQRKSKTTIFNNGVIRKDSI